MKETDDRNLAESIIKAVCTTVLPYLDEKKRRHPAGCMACAYGRGGESLVSRFSDMAWNTVHRGAEEIKNGVAAGDNGSVRKAGAGRKTEVD